MYITDQNNKCITLNVTKSCVRICVRIYVCLGSVEEMEMSFKILTFGYSIHNSLFLCRNSQFIYPQIHWKIYSQTRPCLTSNYISPAQLLTIISSYSLPSLHNIAPQPTSLTNLHMCMCGWHPSSLTWLSVCMCVYVCVFVITTISTRTLHKRNDDHDVSASLCSIHFILAAGVLFESHIAVYRTDETLSWDGDHCSHNQHCLVCVREGKSQSRMHSSGKRTAHSAAIHHLNPAAA